MQSQRKILYVTVWTDKYIIKGEILSLLGRSATMDNRLSDLVNIDDRPFMPITKATVLTYEGARVEEIQFIALKRDRIIAIYEDQPARAENANVSGALEERIETAMQHLMNPSIQNRNQPRDDAAKASEAASVTRH